MLKVNTLNLKLLIAVMKHYLTRYSGMTRKYISEKMNSFGMKMNLFVLGIIPV